MSNASRDADLMAQVADGDQRAFAQLVERHLPRAYAIARRVLSNQADAEDAAQEAFSKVWTHAREWQPARATFSTWFYRILVNASLDLARRHGGRRELTDSDSVLAELLDLQPALDSVHAQAREAEAIQQAVQRLPDNQRMAVVLCYFEDHSNPQAAELMGLHIKALEGLLGRARNQLRNWLGKMREESL
jgi:RNA polymerase sigma-70 factor (ECF subfamily)